MSAAPEPAAESEAEEKMEEESPPEADEAAAQAIAGAASPGEEGEEKEKKEEREGRLVAEIVAVARRAREAREERAREAGDDGDSRVTINALLSCSCCYGIMLRPHTMECGHSLCEACCTKIGKCPLPGRNCRDDLGESLRARFAKNGIFKEFPPPSLNITLSKVIGEKVFPGEQDAAELRVQGNQALARGSPEEALSLYAQGVEKCVMSHQLWGNKAQVLLSLGRPKEALEAAEEACKLQPTWSKAHFRRALALEQLGDPRASLAAFAHCAAILEEEFRRTGGHGATRTDVRSAEGAVLRLAKAVFQEGRGGEGWSERVGGRNVVDAVKGHAPPVCDKGAGEVLRGALSVEDDDLECKLCFSVLCDPTTCVCGHSFCRSCLVRTLDHSQACPYCRTCLKNYLAAHRESGHLLENQDYCAKDDSLSRALNVLAPQVMAERRQQIDEQEAAAAEAQSNWIPIFVCNTALPSVKCPLHIFEPRYRLMLRRCIETTHTFGMCAPTHDGSFEDVGTLLKITECAFTTDGRSHADCIGTRVFRVLERGERDGYSTARVEWLSDEAVEGEEAEAELNSLAERARAHVTSWQASMAANWAPLCEQIGEPPMEDGALIGFWMAGFLGVTLRGGLDFLSQEMLLIRNPQERLEKIVSIVDRAQPQRCMIQ